MIHTIDMTLTSEQVGVQLLVIELKQFQRCSNFEKKTKKIIHVRKRVMY